MTRNLANHLAREEQTSNDLDYMKKLKTWQPGSVALALISLAKS